MVIDKIALTLAIIGALNWGSVGLFGFDCVAFLFGGQIGMLSRVIYTLGRPCRHLVHHDAVPRERADGKRRPGVKNKRRGACPLLLFLR